MANGDTFTDENGQTYMEWDGKQYPVDLSIETPTYHTVEGKVYGGTRRGFTPENVPTAPVNNSRIGRIFRRGKG